MDICILVKRSGIPVALLILCLCGIVCLGNCSKNSNPAPPVINAAPAAKAGFTLTSPSFENGKKIPARYTCDGENVSPELNWINPPDATQSFALVCHDPDAPGGDWVHWVIYMRSGDRRRLPENLPNDQFLQGVGVQGKNDFGKYGYGGPCPPRPAEHRYFFILFALDKRLDIQPGITRTELEAIIKDHITGHTQLMGRYKRK
jgi:Raf kinase inhibitor-like YbhB/YbcL family protein